ncbi:unnamed protein product [Microthlaspi erraticum]|uniref:LOB domain-containing protein n=1 Tax=Microthlaspi erraticum TaxID=1685480 RepID=A0A6D2JLD7_9BRAS|nr:unnamed protein product [Microthlaspi erraticum]CAA7041914.1 unnamed protein product [Microthlaspi erraticum]
MTGSGSPCGACKFLRRKCVKGCVFAPYFCYEQGASHFAAIHQVFGASNASKLLYHIPMEDRCEAAVTIYYEAQARLHDPIYGCVSHIFSLQQQVANLQAQLEILKQQAAQSMIAADSPSIVISNYCQDTKPQHLQESQAIHRHHNHFQHQDGLFETEPYSDLKNIMTSYSELDQHSNTFNQYQHGSNDLLSANFGYISYS